MKKILVTGGAGFVGSCLIAELQKVGNYQIASLDNYFTGNVTNHVLGVEYIKGNCKDIERLVSFLKPHIVFHFGEYSRISTSFKDFDKVWESNCQGTMEVLKYCQKHKCKLIYAASSTKFADNNTNRDASPYAFFKSQNTDLINNYSNWFGLDYAICYFYNVYGKHQIKTGKYATVIGIYEEQYYKSEPLTVVLPGFQTRDFTHIDDVVAGLKILINKGEGDGYCFGTGKSYQMIEVAKMFKDEIVFLDQRRGERFESFIDLKKSYELGWKHKIDLRDYIKEFKRRLK